MNNLIICPVGNPLTFDKRFNHENHWRYVKSNRDYKTLVFQYNDFTPEENSYDEIIKKTGFKWNLSKEYFNNNDYSKYEYIGFMDDDLVTDIDNINRALNLAKERQLKIFQLSLTEDSDLFFKLFYNKKNVKYTTTNFVETMGMFIHSSLMPIILDFWNRYDIYCGWGFDKVLCDITKTDGAVIHASQMYHPKKISSYDRSKAFEEMDFATNVVAPKFMKDYYDEVWQFKDCWFEKQIIFDLGI